MNGSWLFSRSLWYGEIEKPARLTAMVLPTHELLRPTRRAFRRELFTPCALLNSSKTSSGCTIGRLGQSSVAMPNCMLMKPGNSGYGMLHESASAPVG